jgi:two-component sensor histidine kinase
MPCEGGDIAIIRQDQGQRLSAKFRRFAALGLVIILLLMTFIFGLQYSQARSKLLQQLQSAVEERTIYLNGIMARLSNQNDFMRIWCQYYLSTASDALPASPLISMMEHHEQGNFFYIDQLMPPYQRAEVGSIIVGGNSLSGKDALANKKLGAALGLFEFQHIAHQLNPFLIWSYCVFLGSIGNIYPWVPSEMLARSFADPNHASREIGGGQTRMLVSPENNPERTGVWTKAYIDKISKGLMITRASPVYHDNRFEGFVCMDISLDFLAQFAQDIDPFNHSPLLVNHAGQVLAGAEGSKTELPPGADAMLSTVFNLGFEEIIRRSTKRFALINGVDVISLPLENAGWHVVYSISEWRIAGYLISNFIIYPILVFCVFVFFIAAHRLLKTNYILPSIALVDYIQNEASGADSTVPAVPGEWADSFHRLTQIFELKTVTTNMPGGIFILIRNSDRHTSLHFVSQWISRLTGIGANDLIRQHHNWMDIIHPDDHLLVTAAIDDSADHLSVLNVECRLVTDEANPVWIRIASYPRRNRENIIWDGLMLDITDRKRAELQLRRAFEEKEVLLREISHRTKNNMQVIHGLLALQSSSISDPTVQGLFKETQNRIMSIARAHQMLYQTKDLTHIDFKTYLYELSSSLLRSYQSVADKVHLDFQAEPVAVSLDVATTCGLVVNELISNSLKYAFPENRQGTIWMRLFTDTDQLIHLCVGDDGNGFPENFSIKHITSLGFRLITNLVERQLQGTLEIDIHGNPEFRICFKNV